mmetsp:Transcript_18785/g.29318  ORF Transcript_18785/g.29318 Transcript_18785/m.29318 type:complete len:572 (+) Transcript_18785:387-2102(+)
MMNMGGSMCSIKLVKANGDLHIVVMTADTNAAPQPHPAAIPQGPFSQSPPTKPQPQRLSSAALPPNAVSDRVGVGLTIAAVNGAIIVVALSPVGSARWSGKVEKGDTVCSVMGFATTGMSPEQVIDMINNSGREGHAPDTVEITFQKKVSHGDGLVTVDLARAPPQQPAPALQPTPGVPEQLTAVKEQAVPVRAQILKEPVYNARESRPLPHTPTSGGDYRATVLQSLKLVLGYTKSDAIEPLPSVPLEEGGGHDAQLMNEIMNEVKELKDSKRKTLSLLELAQSNLNKRKEHILLLSGQLQAASDVHSKEMQEKEEQLARAVQRTEDRNRSQIEELLKDIESYKASEQMLRAELDLKKGQPTNVETQQAVSELREEVVRLTTELRESMAREKTAVEQAETAKQTNNADTANSELMEELRKLAKEGLDAREREKRAMEKAFDSEQRARDAEKEAEVQKVLHERMVEDLRQERDKEFEQAITLHQNETQRILAERNAKYEEQMSMLNSQLLKQSAELAAIRTETQNGSGTAKLRSAEADKVPTEDRESVAPSQESQEGKDSGPNPAGESSEI